MRGRSITTSTHTLGAHHIAVHEGRLIAELRDGRPSYFHADGSPYGAPLTHVGRAEILADAFNGLVNLGYKQGVVRRALARIPSHLGGLDEIVRAALRILAPPGMVRSYNTGGGDAHPDRHAI